MKAIEEGHPGHYLTTRVVVGMEGGHPGSGLLMGLAGWRVWLASVVGGCGVPWAWAPSGSYAYLPSDSILKSGPTAIRITSLIIFEECPYSIRAKCSIP